MHYPSRAELVQLPESVRFVATLTPHHIKSSPTCDHTECVCECPLTFSCPLCQFDSLSLTEAEKHYFEFHWEKKIFFASKYVLFPCGYMHATSRQSFISRTLAGFHFHCPFCSVTSPTCELIVQHLSLSHPQRPAEQGTNTTLTNEADHVQERSCGFEMVGRIGFSPFVRVREFPLALSIAEQAGGRSETKKPPPCFDNYIRVHEVIDMVQIDTEVIGCNRPVMKLFRDCCFLVCGVDLAPHTIAAILSLGGTITGASYIESEEWNRITHVLLGDRLGSRSLKKLKRSEDVKWVNCDWVRDRVERGSLLGVQKNISPSLLDRVFSVREATARADRRRSQRTRLPPPDIPLRETSRRPSPVLETSNPLLEEMSFQFRSTPEASPVTSSAAILPQEIPFMTSPEATACTLPPIPNRPRRNSAASNPSKSDHPISATPLRRSRRSTVIVSPGKFAHHLIKKD